MRRSSSVKITTEEPKDIAYELYLDETSKSIEGGGSLYGPVRSDSKLFMEGLNGVEPFEIGVENALIVVAKIVLCKTAGVEPPYRPHIVNLALANGFGQIFIICENNSFDLSTATTATGAVLTGGKKTSLDEMRALILKYLGSNNVLVGFNLGWTLAALGLVLPGSHVIDIGTEEAFQSWCRSLSGLQKGWPGVLVEHMINSYDRRIPAVLLNLNIYPEGQVDVWYEAFYTASVWNVIAIQVADARARLDVHTVKLMVPVGSGTAPTVDEEVYLTIEMDLTSIQSLPGLNQLAANPAELVAMVVSTPVSKMRRHGSEAELQNFIDQCRAMVVEYQPRVQWPPSFRSDFGDHNLRNQMAVNLALPSHFTMEDPFLMTLLINHHTGASIKELQSIDLGNKEISTPIGRRCLTIWLDFGLNAGLFERFRNRGLPQPEERNAPEETATTTSAPENSKKTASEGGGVSGAATTAVETGSSAANLAADEPTTSASRLPVVPATHRPVQLAPVAPGTIEGATQSKQSARAKLKLVRRAPRKVVPTTQASTSVGPAVDLTGSTPPRPSTPVGAAELSPSKRLLRSSTPTGSPTKSAPTSAVASPGREELAASTRSQTPQEASGTD